MVRILGLVDWVRAIASEPNMHPIRRRFNLNAVGSYLARRKQREQPAAGCFKVLRGRGEWITRPNLEGGACVPDIETNYFEPEIAEFIHEPWRHISESQVES
jgi:hypothetical protein